MSAHTVNQARQSCQAVYDRLSRQLSRGMYLQTDEIDEWSRSVTKAEYYGLTDLHRQLCQLIAKPREDAGKSISKAGPQRKANAVDAFNALFVGGL